MNVDREFFSIVEQLGPIGDIDLQSFESHPAIRTLPRADEGCGCATRAGESCCSSDKELPSAGSGGFPAICRPAEPTGPAEGTTGNGPANPTVTPYPKWDPETQAWWSWDSARGGWFRAA